jgi:hypothetical protein
MTNTFSKAGRFKAATIFCAASIAAAPMGSGLALAARPTQTSDSALGLRPSVTRPLSAVELRRAEITGTAAARAVVSRAAKRADLAPRQLKVYRLGEHTVVVSNNVRVVASVTTSPSSDPSYKVGAVVKPRNRIVRAGQDERQSRLGSITQLAATSVSASAFRYDSDGYFRDDVNTWYRETWWKITHAWSWRACSTCAKRDYYRLYGKMRAAAKTGAGPSDGYKRAWMEMALVPNSTPLRSFEANTPESSIAGKANQTTTVGYGGSVTVNLGAPPVSGSGTLDYSYTGAMTRSTENWHPIIRSQVGSGGVQWCRYESAEYTGTRTMTARVGYSVAEYAVAPGWKFLTGQTDTTDRCPTQS